MSANRKLLQIICSSGAAEVELILPDCKGVYV